MAAKVGSSAVSYGIGVQNRYSAFLEDEDGIVLSSVAIASANSMKHPNDAQSNNSNKQKGSLNGSQKSASSKLNGRTENSSGVNKKNDAQQKNLNLINGQQKQIRSDLKGNQQRISKPQQPQQQLSGAKTTQAPRQANASGRPGNFSQDSQTSINNSKFSRNQANGNLNHQPNASHQQNKENETGLKSNKGNNTNNQRFNRPRQFQTEDRKSGQQQDGQMNGNGPQTSEDEKRRRQQKRAMDLKYKETEMRESRRNQATNGSGEQAGPDNQVDNGDAGQRGQRNRRDRIKGPDEAARGPKSPRVRAPRTQEGESNGERRDGQPGVRRGDRPPRNRNGFGAGSRGSHGSRGENKNQEKPKPIPNFSDKSDFPSLAS